MIKRKPGKDVFPNISLMRKCIHRAVWKVLIEFPILSFSTSHELTSCNLSLQRHLFRNSLLIKNVVHVEILSLKPSFPSFSLLF